MLIRLALTIFALACLGGCNTNTLDATLMFRLDAWVEFDGHQLSGSAVQAVSIRGMDPPLFSTDPRTTRWWGEAIDIPTRDGGAIFLLLDDVRGGGGYGDAIVERCGIVPRPTDGYSAAVALRDFQGSCLVDVERYPASILIMSDAHDPTTLAVAGSRVKLRRVMLTAVKAMPVVSMPQRYGWMKQVEGTQFPKWPVATEGRPSTVWLSEFYRRKPGA